MRFGADGERKSSEIVDSVRKSDHRTTYKEVTARAEGDEAMRGKYPDLIAMCADMKELCGALTARRERLGNIDLSVKEAHIYLDERGDIVIPDYQRTISQKMTTQFTLCANAAVAQTTQ